MKVNEDLYNSVGIYNVMYNIIMRNALKLSHMEPKNP